MRPTDYLPIIERALAEDLMGIGDITSNAVIPPGQVSRARVIARSAGVVAGLTIAETAFSIVDDKVRFSPAVEDGAMVGSCDLVARVEGSTRSILLGERTALNLMGRMSGVATATRRLVDVVAGTGARIFDTRKTMPGLRALDKYAVTVGGGFNHRMGLYDAVLIKDNHIVAAGDIAEAVSAARAAVGPDVTVEVEVENLDQLQVVLGTAADRVMLDNMDLATMRKAVEMVGGAMEVEASGGVTLETVRSIAETGVDIISVGWITHSAPQLDLALDF